jgi:hypothetical protein
MRKLYVGSLPCSITDESLLQLFAGSRDIGVQKADAP